MTTRSAVCAATALLVAAIAGCEAPSGGDERGFQSRMVRDAQPEKAIGSAAHILRREFGRVASQTQANRLVSEPLEYSTASDSGTGRDLYGGRSKMRRTATFACAPRGDALLIQLRVDIEREDSDRLAATPQEPSRLGDSPAQTAIERDAATTTRQNQAWVFVRRDYRLERSLLDELSELLSPPPLEPAKEPQ